MRTVLVLCAIFFVSSASSECRDHFEGCSDALERPHLCERVLSGLSLRQHWCARSCNACIGNEFLSIRPVDVREHHYPCESDYDIITTHNEYRRLHQARPLMWNSHLASKAKQRASACLPEHPSVPYKETLFASAESIESSYGRVAVDTWYNEIHHYRFSNNEDEQQDSTSTGQFTQLVWRGSRHVGCWLSMCGALRFLVCLYDPPGNVPGSYTENVLPIAVDMR